MSDHCTLAMLVSNSLTDSRLVNLIDVTLACEDGNSKLVVTVWLCLSLTDWLTHWLLFSRLDGYEWYQLLDVFASATESCEKVETSCVSCPPQLVKVIKFSTDSKSADNLKVVGNISESKRLVCWQDMYGKFFTWAISFKTETDGKFFTWAI